MKQTKGMAKIIKRVLQEKERSFKSFRKCSDTTQIARQLLDSWVGKKVRKERSKAYREIFRLRVALKREETLKETYKTRCQRHSKYNNRSKEEDAIIKRHDSRKAKLLFLILDDCKPLARLTNPSWKKKK